MASQAQQHRIRRARDDIAVSHASPVPGGGHPVRTAVEFDEADRLTGQGRGGRVRMDAQTTIEQVPDQHPHSASRFRQVPDWA
ncbi:hypothetical protein [Sciscionella marina]|uniref:hypothetical protein n=1 Tax=Sciscionella marina TaxID=508770 RepID=UPI00036D0D39|nr:hypothetical protein [Sciscionella marina]